MTAAFMALFIFALGSLLFLVRWAKNRWDWHPELARKLVHISMGLSCMSFPILFDKIWMVWLLLALSLGLLFAVRWNKRGRALMGDALHSVERHSFGEVWFALAVAIAFTWSQQQQLDILYWVAMLVLSFSDAAAALIGIRYGKLRFITSDGQKSLEGSTAFFVSCFFLVAFPLAILTEASALTVLLISLIISLLIMLIEGASWDGIDNLLIPVSTFLLLDFYLGVSDVILALHLLLLLSLITAFIWLRQTTLLDGSGLLGVILIGFFLASLGGVAWLLAPSLYFILYNYFARRRGQTDRYIHNIKAVLAIAGFSLLAVIGDYIWSSPLWILLSIAAISNQLTLTGLVRRAHFSPQQPRSLHYLMAVLQGATYINLPCFIWISGFNLQNLGLWMLFSSLGLMLSLILFSWRQPDVHKLLRDDRRWIDQGLAAIIAAMVTVALSAGRLSFAY